MCLHKPLKITKDVREQKYWYKVYTLSSHGNGEMRFSPIFYHTYFASDQCAPYKVGDKLYRYRTIPKLYDHEGRPTKINRITYGAWAYTNYNYPVGFHCYRTLDDARYEKRIHGNTGIVKVEVGTLVAYGTEISHKTVGVFKTIKLVEYIEE